MTENKSFKPQQAQCNLQNLMDAFQQHLVSIGGGDKTSSTARMHRRNVERMITDILNGEPYAAQRLRRLKNIDQQLDGLVPRMLATYSAATVGVYIGSLLHFVRFLRVNTQFLTGFCQL
jgi:hypothetical protein